MAEIKLLLTRNDIEQLANEIFAEGAYMVPDWNYDMPEYTRIATIEEFKKVLDNTRLFFILHSNWELEPLEMKEFIRSDFGKKYFIAQKSGGPTIDFFSSKEFLENGQKFVGSGFLAFHEKYWSLMQNENRQAPENLKLFYKKLVSNLKKNFIGLKGMKNTYWISQATKQLLDEGKLKCSIEF